MIRIAYIIDAIETPDAGTEQQLLMLLGGLDRSRFDARLFCLRQSSCLRTIDPGVPTEVLAVSGLGKPGIVREQRKLSGLLRSFKCDIIHALYFDSVVVSAMVSRFAGSPTLVTSRRGFINSEKPQRLKTAILRGIAPAFRACICNSHALADFVKQRERFPDNRLFVIHNGYDLSRFDQLDLSAGQDILAQLGAAKDDLVVAMTANLRPVKNIQFLVRGAAHLLESYPHLRFVVMGEGSEREKIENQAAELGITGRFHLLGNVPSPEAVLSNAHIGVLTSHSESLSNALIEYSASGLPVVASDVGGNGEIIDTGQTGLLYRSEQIDQFVAQMSRLIEDKALRTSLGQAGRQLVRTRFSDAGSIDGYERVYESLVQKS